MAVRAVSGRLLVVLACVAGAAVVTGGPPAVGSTAVADAQSAPDFDSALLIAQTYGHPVVDLSAESATSETLVNPDGSSTVDTASQPVRMLQNGTWVPIDMTLRVAADGSVVPADSPVPITLGGGGSTSLAVLRDGAVSVGYGWAQPLPAPVLSGPTATYAGVRPGVDLVVSATVTGFETSFVYHSQEAAASSRTLALPLNTTGLTATRDASGDTSYVDAAGTTVAITPNAQAWDARGGGTAEDSALSNTVDAPDALVSSSSSSSGQAEQVSVPASLLNSSATVYPLVVDPAVNCTACGEIDHGYVENDGYDEIDSSFDGGDVHVGTYDGSTLARGMYSFGQGPVHGQSIASAYLKLTEVDSWNSTDRPVTVYKSAPFDKNSNWSPAVTTTNDVVQSFGYGHDVIHAAPAFNVTGIVADFANDASQTRFYFQVRANNDTVNYESDVLYWKEFAPTATLEVTYHSIPVIANNFSVTPCFARCAQTVVTSSASPVVEGQASTSDGEHLDYYFDYAARWSSTSPGRTEEVGNVASGTDKFHLTASALGSGDGDYLYRFRACDSGSTVCATSAWFRFWVDTSGPSAPTATSPAFDLTGATRQGAENQSGQVSVRDDSSGYTGVYEIAYSFTPGPTTPPPCNTTSGDVVALPCGTDLGFSSAVTFSVIPPAGSNTLYVWVYDLAGRMKWSGFPINVNFTAADKPDHAWIERNAADTMPPATSVADYRTDGLALPLNLSGNASWLGANMGPYGNDDGLSFTGAFTATGAAGAATPTTAGGQPPLTIDAFHAMTVVAWVHPNQVNDGQLHTAVAMDGAARSQFYLQEYGGGWRFCMPTSQTSSGTDCVSSVGQYGCTSADADSPSVANQWTLLVGEWDPAARALKLYVYNPSIAAAPHCFSLSHSTVPAADAGAITVGRARPSATLDPNLWNLWNGAIAHPFVYNSVLDTPQRNSFINGLPGTLGNGSAR